MKIAGPQIGLPESAAGKFIPVPIRDSKTVQSRGSSFSGTDTLVKGKAATKIPARSDTANIGSQKRFKEVLNDYDDATTNKVSVKEKPRRQNNDGDHRDTRSDRNKSTDNTESKDKQPEKKGAAPVSEYAAAPVLLVVNQWYAIPPEVVDAGQVGESVQEGGESKTDLATPNENSLTAATDAPTVLPGAGEATAETPIDNQHPVDNQYVEMSQAKSQESRATEIASPSGIAEGQISAGPTIRRFLGKGIDIKQKPGEAVSVSQRTPDEEVTTVMKTAATDTSADVGSNPDDNLAFATEIGSSVAGAHGTPEGTIAVQSESSRKDAAQGERSQQRQQDPAAEQSFTETAGTDGSTEVLQAADIRKSSQTAIRGEDHGVSSLKPEAADSTEHHGPTNEHFSDISLAKQQATQTKSSGSGPLQRSFTVATSEEAERKVTNPAQGIQLRMNNGQQEGGVDIQVVERGGKLQVAVRTEDPDLQSALRDDLGRLVSQVQDHGLKAEVWTPSGGLAHGQTGEFQNESGSSFNQSPSGGHSGGSNQGQQDERSARPAWLDQLEETFGLRQREDREEREWVQILRH